MAVTIFISYSRNDRDDKESLSFMQRLEESGITYFFDEKDIRPGDMIQTKINDALYKCTHLLVLISKNSMRSKWVSYETAIAKKQGLIIVPFLIDSEITPNDLPLDLQNYQALIPKNVSKFVESLTSGKPISYGQESLFPSVWYLPYPRNAYFTGRDELIRNINVAFTKEEKLVANNVAITGMGGIGKTQLALEYIYRNIRDYKTIWWVDAYKQIDLKNRLADLAVKLDLTNKRSGNMDDDILKLKSWLKDDSEWLLIFDNVKNPEEIKEYLSAEFNGHIIITSRYEKWKPQAVQIDVNTFNDKEARDFLEKKAALKEGEDRDVGKLSKKLDFLPLALEMAGSYIKKYGISVKSYLELYNKHEIGLHEKTKPEFDYDKTLFASMQTSINKIEENSKGSERILRFLGYIAPEGFPYLILCEHTGFFPDDTRAFLKDELILNDVVQPLIDYSLIRCSKHNLSINRLIQDVIRNKLSEQENKEWIEIAVQVINAAFPDGNTGDVRTWEKCEALLPHALVATERAEKEGIGLEPAGRLLNQVGLFLKSRASYSEAEEIFHKALSLRIMEYGEMHREVGTCCINIGSLYNELGIYDKSESFLTRGIEIWKSTIGEEHEDTAEGYNNLAKLYTNQGLLDEALQLLQKALRIHRQHYGPNDYRVAISLNDLANIYYKQGNYEPAEKCYKEALEIDKESLPEDHPHRGTTLNNLAGLYFTQKRYEDAKVRFLESLDINRKWFGEDHPSTISSYNNLGILYEKQGDFQKAEFYVKKTLELREKRLGLNHPQIALSLQNLGELYISLKKHKEAEEYLLRALRVLRDRKETAPLNLANTLNSLGEVYYSNDQFEIGLDYTKQALELRREHLGTEHLDTIVSLNNLGAIYGRLGRYDDACIILEQVLESRKKQLKDADPALISGTYNLAALYGYQKKYEQAEGLLKDALESQERRFGKEYFGLLEGLDNLAKLYTVQGKHNAAEPLYKRALEIQEKLAGPESSEAALALTNLGINLYSQRKYEDAEHILRKALIITEAKEDRDHLNVASCLTNLVKTLSGQGKYKEAEPLLNRALDIAKNKIGTKHPYTGGLYGNLGIAYLILDNIPQAITFLEKAYDIFRDSYGDNHPNTKQYKDAYIELRSANKENIKELRIKYFGR